jgi:hypothetical protein
MSSSTPVRGRDSLRREVGPSCFRLACEHPFEHSQLRTLHPLTAAEHGRRRRKVDFVLPDTLKVGMYQIHAAGNEDATFDFMIGTMGGSPMVMPAQPQTANDGD